MTAALIYLNCTRSRIATPCHANGISQDIDLLQELILDQPWQAIDHTVQYRVFAVYLALALTGEFMEFPKHGLAPKSFDLGKAVLWLAALGIFTKLLKIDLSRLELLGVRFDPATSALIPGFLGLALIYAYIVFCVARLEAGQENLLKAETREWIQSFPKYRLLQAASFAMAVLSSFAYSTPLILGAFSIVLLRRDIWSVATAIWTTLV